MIWSLIGALLAAIVLRIGFRLGYWKGRRDEYRGDPDPKLWL